MISKSAEKGQALVMIALAAVALFAFAALAIDGSRVFSDRRHSQNASDTATYAAALARVRGKSDVEWKKAGTDRAQSNGYKNDGVAAVEVYSCKEWKNLSGEECKGLPATLTDAIRDEYVTVRIKSVVDLTLARVIGWRQVTNYTDAVVHASPVKIDEWYDGKAIVSTKKDCPKPGDNYVPLVFGGNGATVVNNSGIFVNSSCNPAIKDNGNSDTIKTTEGVCVYGGVPSGMSGFYDTAGNPLPPDDHCGTQVDITEYWMPDSDPSLLASYCDDPGDIADSGSEYLATPGYFNKTGNKTFPDVSPAGTLRLQKGVYCLHNGISLNANWTITTDVDGNGAFDPSTEGVFFYIIDGDVTFNGGSNLTLRPMENTDGGIDSRLLDYLIFIPSSHTANVTVSGNNGSAFSGEILAPSSHITLDGGGNLNSFTLNAQIIGYNTTITGSGSINITYDPNHLPPAMIMPKISTIE